MATLHDHWYASNVCQWLVWKAFAGWTQVGSSIPKRVDVARVSVLSAVCIRCPPGCTIGTEVMGDGLGDPMCMASSSASVRVRAFL